MVRGILILFILSSIFTFGQTSFENYKRYDIKNSSCEILNSINLELKNSSYGEDFIKHIKNEQNKYPLQSQSQVNDYITSFNSTLDKTKKQYETQEFLWNTGKEIGKYGLSVLGNYAESLPTKHLTNFLTPAIQQGFELYIDNEIKKNVDENKDKIDKIIIDRINLLYTNGIDVRNANDEESFKALFALAHADIPALDREQYGVFNKELTKRAYEFINKNRNDIKLLDLKVEQKYDDIKTELSSKIDELQKKITTNINVELTKLGESIVELTKNQEFIFNTLDDIQERIKINEKKISVLENEMLLVKENITELKNKQEEHSKLISQNSFQIDILSGYAFQNLNTTQKINALEKGHFDNVFNNSEKQKLLKELNDIKTKETIISVASDIENYSTTIYSGLVNTGILKGQDAKNVGKFINGVSVISGVARVYAGDVSGLTSIVSGLGGLSGKKQENPEIQMLKQMFEFMNQRFDKIDQHLDRIESKLDSLSSTTFSMYKSMAISFQYTSEQLETINWKVDNLNIKATSLLYKDYKVCKTLNEIWKTRNVSFSSFSDYKTYYNLECKQCLQGLSDFTIEKNNSYFFVSSNEELKNEDYIKNEITKIYNPTKNLFKIFYDKNIELAIYSTMFPFSYTKDANKPMFYLSKIKNLKKIDSEEALENYYSYEMIIEFTDLILSFSNYFLIKGGDENFNPIPINDFLKSNTINGINKDLLEARLLKLLNIIQYSISQQSLSSGNLMLDPIYSTLFYHSTNQHAKDLSIEVLNNNKILSSNFAIYLINKNIDFSDTLKVKKLFEDSTTNKESLDTLNSLIKIDDIKFIADNNRLKLYLTFERNGQLIKILLPDFTTIMNNKMINSDAIYSLLNCRQKINSKLIDLTFNKNLELTNNTINQFKYHYTPIE